MSFRKRKQTPQSLGGQACVDLEPPAKCPRCGESMQGRSYHSYLGHQGLHGMADKYFGGDIKACQKRLQENGRARQDSAPWNGAWKRYQPLPVTMEIGGEEMLKP